jgi:hypothetical protein
MSFKDDLSDGTSSTSAHLLAYTSNKHFCLNKLVSCLSLSIYCNKHLRCLLVNFEDVFVCVIVEDLI